VWLFLILNTSSLILILIDGDELIPQEGKDGTYDKVVSEICDLEKSLEADLKKFEKTLGCVKLSALG
jgi:DNA mismatch repair protein MSH6